MPSDNLASIHICSLIQIHDNLSDELSKNYKRVSTMTKYRQIFVRLIADWDLNSRDLDDSNKLTQSKILDEAKPSQRL